MPYDGVKPCPECNDIYGHHLRQIVESEVANQAPPKDAKYLGERDNSVEQETKAKQVDSFRKGGAMSKDNTFVALSFWRHSALIARMDSSSVKTRDSSVAIFGNFCLACVFR